MNESLFITPLVSNQGDIICRDESRVVNVDITMLTQTEASSSAVPLLDRLDQSEVGQKGSKRKNKTAKKSTKLDARSKLEKSRQSARECRARKKLRYQYLEDLVNNREKAVVKLREELSTVGIVLGPHKQNFRPLIKY